MMQRQDAVRQDAAADQKHGCRADHREQTHQFRRRQQQDLANALGSSAALGQ